MSIGNNPELKEKVATGSAEIDAGDLKLIEVDYDIVYSTDGNSISRGEYKITTFLPLAKDKEKFVAIDLSSIITESAVDELLEDHLF